MEDRLQELEAQNAMLESQVEAMGDVITRQALAQLQVQPPLAVNQNPEPVAMSSAMEGVRTGCLAKISVSH